MTEVLVIEDDDAISELLECVKQAGGSNGRGGKEYNAWDNRAYEARNAIVHRGKHGHGDQEAEAAFKAATTYMDVLRSGLA